MDTRNRHLLAIFIGLGLTACGGGSNDGSAYTVGGQVSGLLQGATVELQNNGADDLTLSKDGAFTFGMATPANTVYSVTIAVQPTGGNCAVSNGSGSRSGGNVSNVSVICSPLPYKIGVTVTGLADVSGLALQNNGTDNLSISTSGIWSFSTAVATQTKYVVSILTQPSGHICSVINGSGTVNTASVDVTVVCPWHFAYVLYPYVAGNPNTVTSFSIDQATGGLSAGLQTVLTGSAPIYVAVSPNGKFCYVVNDSGTVSAYTIDPITGELTQVAKSPFAAGIHPASIAVSQDSKFAYVPNSGSNDISAFSIDASTGALYPIPGSPFPSGAPTGTPESIALDPTGKFAFVANGPGTTTVDEFSIDSLTGALTAMAGNPLAAGGGPRALAFAPNGTFLYEADDLGTISAYAFSPPNGAITPVAGSPFMVGGELLGIQVDPIGRFLYVADTELNNIPGFAINSSSGVLAPLIGSPFMVNTRPNSVVIDPTGMYAYVTYYHGDGEISAYSVDSTGALIPIVSDSFEATFGGASIAIVSLQ